MQSMDLTLGWIDELNSKEESKTEKRRYGFFHISIAYSSSSLTLSPMCPELFQN